MTNKEWLYEPDRKHWIDPETGLDCLIVRSNVLKNLCGYVGIPKDHPWYGKGYNDLEAEVHGGLTFSGECSSTICHGEDGEKVANEEVWWLGFDCAHSNDLVPEMMRHGLAMGTYKNIAYVEKECTSLSKQIAAVQFTHSTL